MYYIKFEHGLIAIEITVLTFVFITLIHIPNLRFHTLTVPITQFDAANILLKLITTDRTSALCPDNILLHINQKNELRIVFLIKTIIKYLLIN